jgi:hypothetical protein
MTKTKVRLLQEKLENYKKKIWAQIEKIQAKCKHEKTESCSGYGGTSTECLICGKFLK